jgi:hypothetical protein
MKNLLDVRLQQAIHKFQNVVQDEYGQAYWCNIQQTLQEIVKESFHSLNLF